MHSTKGETSASDTRTQSRTTRQMLFKKDIGDAVKRVIADDMDADAVHLVRAAQVVGNTCLKEHISLLARLRMGVS